MITLSRKSQHLGIGFKNAGFILIVLTLLLVLVMPAKESAFAAGETTDLVFIVDGSGSISAVDWQIQKDGISAALQDTASFPQDGSIAVGLVQWSYVASTQRTRVEVPLTVLDNQAALNTIVAQIQGMSQIGSLTNPGDGIRAGTDLLLANAEDTNVSEWILCMSTDGTSNSGESLASATAYANGNGVDKYSVIGIEDPPFASATTLRNHYTPHVFGGGSVSIARNSIEFANLIIGACLGDPVELRALEINQSVQDWHNSVPLITDKSTAVRAFVQVPDGEDDQRVIGRLYGRRGGSDLPGSPLLAINPGSSVLASTDIVSRRDSLDDSLNFYLPLSWRNGTVELEFDAAGAPVSCQEPTGPDAEPANNCKVTVTFQNEVTPEIVFVGVRYTDSGTTFEPSTQELFEQMFRFRSIFPIANIDYRMDTMGNYSSTPSLSTVNSDLAVKRFFDAFFCIFSCSEPTSFNSRYYGVLDGNGGGLANGIPGTVSSGFLSGTGARGDTGYARNRGPHELAHDLDRHHAVDNSLPTNAAGNKVGRCGEVASPSAPGHAPFETVSGNVRPVLGPLSSGVDDEIWGLDNRFLFSDTNGLAVVNPRQTFELMSYCGGGPQGRWISQFTYNGIMGQFPASGVGSSTGSGDDFIVVTGLIDFENDTTTLGPALEMTGNPPSSAAGDHRVQLLDGDGTELAGADFEPIIMDADAEVPETSTGAPVGLILVPLPKPASPVAVIRVLRDGNQIAILNASDNAPEVSIINPVGGESLTDPTVTFEWSGSDADSDPLVYTVLYSADDGNTWTTLTVNTDATSLTVPRTDLTASTTARLRVIVSDGVNSASTISNQFSVGNNAPLVLIDNPLSGAEFSGLQNIDFVGAAFDTEDGALETSLLSWSSDIDGLLGSGEEITINASDLSTGTHVVTLMATDTNGASATDTVTIHIFRVAPPPNQPPTADAGPDQTVECTGPSGTLVTFDGSASSDPDNDSLTFAWSAPGIVFDNPTDPITAAAFPLGTTTVTLTVTDPGGLSDTDTVDITIQDTTPPELTIEISPDTLWPPNHNYVNITLDVSASDICDPSPAVTATVQSSDPDDAKGLGDGNTTGDIKVITADGEVLLSSNEDPIVEFNPLTDQLELRAERGGKENRVYTIIITVSDASGNQTIMTTTVVVPNNQGNR